MAAEFLPSTGQYLDPLGAALGQLGGNWLGGYIQRQALSKDQQALNDWLLQQRTMEALPVAALGGPAGMMAQQVAPPAQTALPQFFTPQYQQLGMNMLASQLQNQLPMDPLQQTEAMKNMAQAQLYGRQAETEGMPEPMTPLDQARMAQIQRQMQKPDYQPGVIENKSTGEQRPYSWGDPIPPGWGLFKPPESVTKIDVNAAAPAERQALAQTQQSIDALHNLRMLFDNPSTRTGPVVGRYDPVAGLVGGTTAEQEALMAATSAFKNHVIKEITGAQMSETEAHRIMKQIPDITDPPVRWRAKWDQSKRNLEMLQRRRREILRKSGLEAPEFDQNQSQNTSNQKVRMLSPDGTAWELDRNEMQEALKHGYTMVR